MTRQGARSLGPFSWTAARGKSTAVRQKRDFDPASGCTFAQCLFFVYCGFFHILSITAVLPVMVSEKKKKNHFHHQFKLFLKITLGIA